VIEEEEKFSFYNAKIKSYVNIRTDLRQRHYEDKRWILIYEVSRSHTTTQHSR